MTNDEFMKDFQEFQQEFEQDNDEWFAEVSTMISTTESPKKKLVQTKKVTRPETAKVTPST